MSEFTISGAATILSCLYPYRDDVVMPSQVPTEGSDVGNRFHAAVANYIECGDHDRSDLEGMVELAIAWIDSHREHRAWVAEPAYAWDPVADTARFLDANINRQYAKYGKLPHEVGGTLDACCVAGDTVYVYEWGTGHDVGHKFHQLRLQCAVAALAHGCVRAVGQVVRFDSDGAYPQPVVDLDEFELAAIRGEYAEYLAEVAGSEPLPGEHCNRCNLAPVCPAAAGIVAEIVPVEEIVPHRWGLTIASPDHAAWLLDRSRLVAAAAEAVKQAVKAYVPETGLVLADGSLLVEGKRNVSRKDHARVESLARALGATDEQIEACSRVVQESAGLKVRKPAKAKKAKAA